jgi:hypothetical protein
VALSRRETTDDGDPSQPVGREFLTAAGADQQQTRGFHAAGRDAGDELVEQLAGEFAARARLLNRAAGRLFEAGFIGEVVVFEDRNDQQVGINLAGRARGQRDVRRRVRGTHSNRDLRVRAETRAFRRRSGPALACSPVGSGLESTRASPREIS